MESEKLYIKHMVCPRCIMVVRDQLQKLDIVPLEVILGEVVLPEPLNVSRREELAQALETVGFELIEDKRVQLVEKIKHAIIELIREEDNHLTSNLSDYITARIPYNYHYLSTLFPEIENSTIEKYFIAQKIERVKELLAYEELTLNEIAGLLNYSSTAHLSNQFKKITGLTPTEFKKQKGNMRKPLTDI